jgi:hypothetical protein
MQHTHAAEDQANRSHKEIEDVLLNLIRRTIFIWILIAILI